MKGKGSFLKRIKRRRRSNLFSYLPSFLSRVNICVSYTPLKTFASTYTLHFYRRYLETRCNPFFLLVLRFVLVKSTFIYLFKFYSSYHVNISAYNHYDLSTARIADAYNCFIVWLYARIHIVSAKKKKGSTWLATPRIVREIRPGRGRFEKADRNKRWYYLFIPWIVELDIRF